MNTPDPRLLQECYSYVAALRECNRCKDVPELLGNVAYVYLGRMERLRLAWKLFLTIFI